MRANGFLSHSPLQEGAMLVLCACVEPTVFLCQLRCEGVARLMGAAMD